MAKRNRGRPVIYQGDPDAPGLDPEHRRVLLRRINNRESARRTRMRNQEELASLYTKVCSSGSALKSLTVSAMAMQPVARPPGCRVADRAFQISSFDR